jgi:hypothetical protein
MERDGSAKVSYFAPLVESWGGVVPASRGYEAFTNKCIEGKGVLAYFCRSRPKAQCGEAEPQESEEPDTEKASHSRNLIRGLLEPGRSIQVTSAYLLGELFAEKTPWCNGFVTLYATGHFDAYVALLSRLPSFGLTRERIAEIVYGMYLLTMSHPIDDHAVWIGRRRMTLGGALLSGRKTLDECVREIKKDNRYEGHVIKTLVVRTEMRNAFALAPDVRQRLSESIVSWRKRDWFPTSSPEIDALYDNARNTRLPLEHRRHLIEGALFQDWLDSLRWAEEDES